jgi:hypothetical protein
MSQVFLQIDTNFSSAHTAVLAGRRASDEGPKTIAISLTRCRSTIFPRNGCRWTTGSTRGNARSGPLSIGPGERLVEVVHWLGWSRMGLWDLCQRYQAWGVDAIFDGERSGRPPVFSRAAACRWSVSHALTRASMGCRWRAWIAGACSK